MNVVYYLIASTVLIVSFEHLHSDKASEKMIFTTAKINSSAELFHQKHPFFTKVYFSKSDAEMILGEKAHLSDSSSTVKKDTLEIKKAYNANSKDKKTGKTGTVYFMIEEYNQVTSAKKAYNTIKVANEKHAGVKKLHDVGDEAYFHSDGNNFCFVLVRKQKTLFRMKVNKITSTTSLDEFNRIAKKISENL
ncbi:hypothetical protein FLJC2902T_22280 [Flavobacterium limnosediminis JC2902]|uniref:Uncharacterized protein n=1 Tax=Flavobacterium limnosediminis JC2902 TaxID=1341181 RepID=V6SRS1_9FLAO|nr:hypothetical protein [Flavobacterium limnosediminis]ESU27120.1 hypothetical protein FLJC2902T_22280 [Flavobacterium limnosediminis JC2902]